MVPTLQRALPIVGAALGRKLGVRVEVSGKQAFTDGERIVLPAFDPENKDQAVKAWGFLSHEAAHVRYTDFNLDDSGSPFRQRLTNLLEDIRIERALSREYPGTAFTLSEVVRHLVTEQRISAPDVRDSPAKVLHDALLVTLRSRVLDQKALAQEAVKAQRTLEATFPPLLLTELNQILKTVPDLDSTRAAQSMADTIISLFQNSEKADNTNNGHDKTVSPPSTNSVHQESDVKTAPLPCEEDKTNSTQGTEEKSANTPEQQTQDKQQDSDNDSGEFKTESSLSKSNKPTESNIRKVLDSSHSDWPEAITELLAGELGSWSQCQEGGLSAVTTTPTVDTVITHDEDSQAGQQLLWKTKAESARLAAQLTGLVQATTLCRDKTGKRGRKLDGKRLHRAAVDDSRLFCKRSEAITIDAVVHLCLDISSSMSSRMVLAREAVLALAYALNQINGVEVSVSAYPGRNECGVFEVMKPSSRLPDVAAVLSALNSHDSTPMATGLWNAVHQVLQAKAERRLVIMVTDGAPDEDHYLPVVDLVKRCQQSGIEVIGLGINVHSVERLFPQSVVITELQALKSALFGLTEHWLVA